LAARVSGRHGSIFFDSALAGAAESRVSLVASDPAAEFEGSIWDPVAWGAVEAVLAERCAGDVGGVGSGMLAGYVGYDGRFWFGLYEALRGFDHASGAWWEVGGGGPVGEAPGAGSGPGPRFEAEMEEADYVARVERAKAYIAAGDIYQVNLARRFSARWGGCAWRFYRELRERSPAPYAAWVAHGETRILCSSPECFLAMQGRRIRTRPIKGTRPRGADPGEDARLAAELAGSRKERAELVMITDLERNDLGQVAEYGSVRVPEMLALERYAQVFHLVSTVEATLRGGVSHAAAFRACFPGGSITGAPKRRAREIIAELEPCGRGVYTGALGYFGFGGESRFNIAIRTVVAEGERYRFHAGAGIVADSDPAAEYLETAQKASGILAAAAALGE
jgi:aminodeoxychorismate synthase component I